MGTRNDYSGNAGGGTIYPDKPAWIDTLLSNLTPADIAQLRKHMPDNPSIEVNAGGPDKGDAGVLASNVQDEMHQQFPEKYGLGSLVPGKGNKDTVPAELTPGEYVVPKPVLAKNPGLLAHLEGLRKDALGSLRPPSESGHYQTGGTTTDQGTSYGGTGISVEPTPIPSNTNIGYYGGTDANPGFWYNTVTGATGTVAGSPYAIPPAGGAQGNLISGQGGGNQEMDTGMSSGIPGGGPSGGYITASGGDPVQNYISQHPNSPTSRALQRQAARGGQRRAAIVGSGSGIRRRVVGSGTFPYENLPTSFESGVGGLYGAFEHGIPSSAVGGFSGAATSGIGGGGMGPPSVMRYLALGGLVS